MTIGTRIKNKREELGIAQVELARKIGCTKQTIYKYENDIVTNIPSDNVEKLASALNTTPAYLMGWDKTSKNNISSESTASPKYIKIPVLGYVAAGIPTDAVENIIDWEEIPAEMAKNAEYFGLVINGDSMEPRICKGDVVIVRKQSDIDSGDIAIVIIDGERGTCKKVVKHSNGISLVSFNQAYEPMFYTWKEVEQLPIIINGKVVELRGKL